MPTQDHARFVTRGLEWLARSERSSGGSAAYGLPLGAWSSAYPETTGYICATLVEAACRLGDAAAGSLARRFATWLLEIQEPEGFWRGGRFPYGKDAGPSIFNTGQILFGLTALAREEPEAEWAYAARRGAQWLAAGVGQDGQWAEGHYRGHQPTYYTHVAWPMLEYWSFSGDKDVRQAAERVLAASSERRFDNGAFEGWGFDRDKPAFTHTIAYTLQGFLESSRLTGDMRWREAALPALEQLRLSTERRHGRLPGTFDRGWKPDPAFECITGSAQVAACFLLEDGFATDARWVNAAAKLVDRVISSQAGPLTLTAQGGVPGSVPLHGAYMRMRYPNWAVKFGIDAVFRLENAMARIDG